jgi:hypothetical protein
MLRFRAKTEAEMMGEVKKKKDTKQCLYNVPTGDLRDLAYGLMGSAIRGRYC